jgi:hypothetical protein
MALPSLRFASRAPGPPHHAPESTRSRCRRKFDYAVPRVPSRSSPADKCPEPPALAVLTWDNWGQFGRRKKDPFPPLLRTKTSPRLRQSDSFSGGEFLRRHRRNKTHMDESSSQIDPANRASRFSGFQVGFWRTTRQPVEQYGRTIYPFFPIFQMR